jgi:hypothetical protein
MTVFEVKKKTHEDSKQILLELCKNFRHLNISRDEPTQV